MRETPKRIDFMIHYNQYGRENVTHSLYIAYTEGRYLEMGLYKGDEYLFQYKYHL